MADAISILVVSVVSGAACRIGNLRQISEGIVDEGGWIASRVDLFRDPAGGVILSLNLVAERIFDLRETIQGIVSKL